MTRPKVVDSSSHLEKATRPTIITRPLQQLLTKHLQETGRQGTDLIFGSSPSRPIGLQECRHTAVSRVLEVIARSR